MIVGFKILDLRGNEKAAADYIRKVCILESPDIADNIVRVGAGVNVFPPKVNSVELAAQPFKSELIELLDGEVIVASAVDFRLEVLYNGHLKGLAPTEYLRIKPTEIEQFSTYIMQGLMRSFPDYYSIGSPWILGKGTWNDSGIWVDENKWRDE